MSWVHDRLCLRIPPGSDPRRLLELLIPDGTEHLRAFQPHGVSGIRVSDRATAVLHTWPEHSVATLDIYGARAQGVRALLRRIGWVPVAEVSSEERTDALR